MLSRLNGAVLALALLAGLGAADAKPLRQAQIVCDKQGCAPAVTYSAKRHVSPSDDPRPDRWCMWWLRRELGIPKSVFPPGGYNIARNGRFIGTAASGPAVGVVVVWRNHIGIITGRREKDWIVKSGNDNDAVRERPRPLRGVIAYRWPHGAFGLAMQ